MPFKRSRTGCITCREDGYKCDEQRPSCGRCVRLGKGCKGYGLRLKWQNCAEPRKTGKHAKTPHKRETPSVALTRRHLQQQPTPALPRAMSSQIPPQHASFLHHWSTVLASLITMAPAVQNQFHAHITPMITHSSPLRSAICFMAANHMSVVKADTSLHNTATRFQLEAVSSLRKSINTESPLVSLAVIMILQITDQLFTTNSGVNHLEGAKGIIERAGPKAWNCDTGVFLLDICSYHDAVVSVSRRTPPILDLGGDTSSLNDMESMRGLKILWEIIGHVSSMCSLDRDAMDIQGPVIEAALRSLDEYSSKGDVGHTIHAYKEAAYIYLHRVWHNVGAPHPATLKHARDCLNHLSQVPVFSPLASVHAWPLWTAACETIDSQFRELARNRVRAMYELRHLPSLKRLEQDIEDIWEMKDRERTTTGVDKVDCVQAILAMRQRGADLV
ncbi:fungal-specific transcription factor domain-containing protein [Nemania sp. FL0916]|nr:fungal-specific transcription factor domain-containing protein [Nemania sp. FL0916]